MFQAVHVLQVVVMTVHGVKSDPSSLNLSRLEGFNLCFLFSSFKLVFVRSQLFFQIVSCRIWFSF